MKISVQQRFMNKVFIDTLFLHKNPNLDPCWLWRGSIHQDRYGTFKFQDSRHLAHRVSYELFVGELLPEFELDHLCRIRRCVNPKHLEQVRHAINMSRSPTQYLRVVTHCPQGHEYALKNTRIYRTYKTCRTCDKLRTRLSRSKIMSWEAWATHLILHLFIKLVMAQA